MRFIHPFAGVMLAIASASTLAQSSGDTSLTPSDERSIRELEAQSWVAWKGHDPAFFEAFLSEDHRAEQNTTCGEARVPSPVWATSLYAKRAGRWVNVLYQHTPVARS